jgi:5-methylcytosine-specific restriction endonuclease McrBC regulatory subunit McrC
MKILEIFENESISLDEEEIKDLLQIKSQSPYLPFFVIDNKLTTADYIIGEIQLKNTLIRIKPRHKVLSLNHYFEMLLYIDKLSNNSIKSSSYSNDTSFGVNGLIKNFIEICTDLLGFGLTGSFSHKKIKSFKPKGKIIFSEYNKKMIPIEGIPTLIDDYKIDNYANQIIKKAILKIQEYNGLSIDNRYSVIKLLNHFENISTYKKDYNNLKPDVINFHSTNPYYSIALEYALKIIMDFKLGYSSEGGVQWNAFLENSNDTFEKYVRKILERELDHKINKWEKPRKFAEINWGKQVGQKAFSPDIIVDFIDGEARAVFDVKNKSFSPSETNPSELTSVADIYQLLFYSAQLNTDICGLIYPSDEFYDPITLDIMGVDINFFLISINMNAEFDKRKESLINNIKYCLKYT